MDVIRRLYTQFIVTFVCVSFQLELGWVSLIAATKSSSGLIVETVSKPEVCQPVAAEGDSLSVRYTDIRSDADTEPTVRDGVITLGDPGNYGGWNEALLGACAGEERRFTVPATLVYRSQMPPSIQSNVNITFNIYIVRIDKPDSINPEIDNSVNVEDLFMTTMVVVTEETDSEGTMEDEDKDETVDKDKTQSGGGKTGAGDIAGNLSFVEVLQFAVIPVAVILVLVVVYYVYKLRYPHKRTTFFKDPQRSLFKWAA